MRSIIVCLLSVAVAAAASAAKKYDLDKIVADDQELYYEWSEIGWNNSVFGAESDIAGLLEKYDYLSDDADLLAYILEKEKKAKDAAEARRMRFLYRDLATTYEAKRVVDLDDEAENRQAQDQLWVPGLAEAVPYRNTYMMLRQTDEREPYMNLWYAALNYNIQVLNPLYRERLARHLETVRAMGYDDYTAFYYQVLGYEEGVPAAQARKLRDETFPMYKEIITARCRKLFGKDPAETQPWESKNMWFGKEYDQYFPQENALAFTYGTFAGMGLDIRALPNVKVDDADRPEKEPRAATWAFRVPSDVRVNLKAVGGAEDYETSFHEFGHALHAGHTDAALPWELRALGSNELTETYAIFFESMYSDRTFLLEEVKMPPAAVDDFLRYKLATGMAGARSIAFDVIYDAVLHDAETTDEEAFAFYEDLIDQHRLFPKYPASYEANYLNVDEGFYALYYMAAYYGAAQLRAKVVADFGPRWYKDPAAGAFLKGLFAKGDSWTLDEMLKEIGYAEGLNPAYLVADFKARYEELYP